MFQKLDFRILISYFVEVRINKERFVRIFFSSFLFIHSFVAAADYSLPSNVRLATAVCTEFPWVSDLPVTSETVSFLKTSAIETWGLPQDRLDSWSNGSGEDFLRWITTLKADPTSTLIFYFSTHQKSDGRTCFSKGKDLSAEKFIEGINRLAENYQRVLLINDSCYAASFEKRGGFSNKVIRLYAAENNESAIDLEFDRGPYGLDEFIKKERGFFESKKRSFPKGLSFLSLMGLKAAMNFPEKSMSTMDLQTLVKEMQKFRDEYNENIRQARAQHLKLVPADANFEILKSKKE